DLLSVLPRERQLPRTHVRLRRAHRDREGAQGDRLRARSDTRRAPRSLPQVEGACARPLARGPRARPSDAVRPCRAGRQGAPMNEKLHQRCWIWVTEVENVPPREGRAVTVAGRQIAIFNLGG